MLSRTHFLARGFALLVFLLAGGLFAAAPAAAIDIRKVTSPGGIEAWLVQEDTLPMITMRFAFRGGAAQDPAERPGVANMLSVLLDEGAGDLDSKAFQDRLDELSIEIGFDAGRDAFFGDLKTLTQNRDEAFRLLGLALNRPRFDADPVERLRAQIATGIRSQLRDPDVVAAKAWMRAAFPNHPYGRPTEGTLDSVAAITVDDLKTLRADLFARDNLLVVVVGAIDAATLGAALDTVFGGLPATAKLKPVADVAPVGGARVGVDMAIPQTVIRFGGRGLLRKDPDFIPAYVANHIIGGGAFSSRLYEEVREKRGLAYSVDTGLSPLDHAGLFVGGTATRADRADEALGLIESEIARFAKDGPTEKEVEAAKAYLIGSYPLRFDNSAGIAGQLLAIRLDDLGIDYVDRRNDLIRAVTVEDVRKAARQLLDGGLTVVRVGQPGA